MKHSPSSNRQKAELSEQRLELQTHKLQWNLHKTSVDQSARIRVTWAWAKAGQNSYKYSTNLAVTLLSCCWWLTLFFCHLLNVSSLDEYKVNSVPLCVLLHAIAECAAEQLLSEACKCIQLWHRQFVDNLCIWTILCLFFFFLSLWKDNSNCLLYLLKCGDKFEKYRDVHEV